MKALRRRWMYLATMLAVVVLDQLSKALVDRLMGPHDSHTLIPGLADLTYVQNRGAAFGILSEANLPHQSVVFAIVGVLALLAIVTYAVRLPAESRLPQTALALVTGGAVGNLIDRARLGYVIDFVDVYWRSHHWPAFNVADSAISIGVTLLVMDMIWFGSEAEKTAVAEAPGDAIPQR